DDADAGGDQHHAEPGERPQLSSDRDDVAALANQHQLRIRRVRLWTITAILAARSRLPATSEAERITITVKSMNMSASLDPYTRSVRRSRTLVIRLTPFPDRDTILGKCGREVVFDVTPHQRRAHSIRHAVDDSQSIGKLDHDRANRWIPLQSRNHIFLSTLTLVEGHSGVCNRTIPIEQVVEKGGVSEVEEGLVGPEL